MLSDADNSLFREQKKPQLSVAPINNFTVEFEAEDMKPELAEKIKTHVIGTSVPLFTSDTTKENNCDPVIKIDFNEYEDYAVYAYFLTKITELRKNDKENSKLFTVKVTACNRASIPVIQWTYNKVKIDELGSLEYNTKDNMNNVTFSALFSGESCDVEMLRAWHKSM